MGLKMTWYDSNWKDRYPVSVNVIGGPESAGPEDVEIIVPKDWDRFWTNIRSDGYDIVVVNPSGILQNFKRASFTFSNRILTLEVDNANFSNRNSVNLLYIYFNNPDQSSDLAGSFVTSSLKAGTITLSRPTAYSVGDITQQQGNETPIATFQKTANENFYIWFRVGSILARRITAYNNHLDDEELDYIKINSLDSSGSNDTNRYTEGETRFVPGWVGVKVKEGTNNTDYTVVANINTKGTALEQTYSARALLKIRDLLPS